MQSNDRLQYVQFFSIFMYKWDIHIQVMRTWLNIYWSNWEFSQQCLDQFRLSGVFPFQTWYCGFHSADIIVFLALGNEIKMDTIQSKSCHFKFYSLQWRELSICLVLPWKLVRFEMPELWLVKVQCVLSDVCFKNTGGN